QSPRPFHRLQAPRRREYFPRRCSSPAAAPAVVPRLFAAPAASAAAAFLRAPADAAALRASREDRPAPPLCAFCSALRVSRAARLPPFHWRAVSLLPPSCASPPPLFSL